MERDLISHIAHDDHPIASPISEAHIDRLLTRARLPKGARVLDLGCGGAQWTLRALALYPDATADGVDISAHALASAAEAAEEGRVTDRIRLHQASATEFTGDDGPYDLVFCAGATHAFGGLVPTMEAIARHLRPGGLALVGEGFWERTPTPEALALVDDPDDYADLAGTVARAESAGYVTVYAHTSELGEWDEYEWSWTGTLLRWAEENPGPDGTAAREAALDHRDMWLKGYRGVLGFVSLLLRRTR
ncbi:class I SAM-dependent methyltransferase [Microtetraspora sp. AC03309]|uniref:SAM-dependent methyltransferase n=1 Tax=Microtetraspora sp. AC03309 TaxID=2779376 RepID=UPI001E52F77A|nr:class I SAM-dependent methyltransferase [Microtetraspora sp. AC03309]MCC5577159.1 class I SAM-dependent methyltransferase [Microtetraspora sp. AC03309]